MFFSVDRLLQRVVDQPLKSQIQFPVPLVLRNVEP